MPHPPPRIFCIGRNYAAHAEELKNALPAAPVVFMKPLSALLPDGGEVRFPSHGSELHFETELVVRIGREGRCGTEAEAPGFIDALGVGFDLTLRDVQERLKNQGLPWEQAKAFDDSALLSELVPHDAALHDFSGLTFAGCINGTVRQRGDSGLMLFPVPRLLVELSRIWRLLPGDLIYTGTPAGVGPLQSGDILEASAPWGISGRWKIGGR